jgi:hypothetical protein
VAQRLESTSLRHPNLERQPTRSGLTGERVELLTALTAAETWTPGPAAARSPLGGPGMGDLPEVLRLWAPTWQGPTVKGSQRL